MRGLSARPPLRTLLLATTATAALLAGGPAVAGVLTTTIALDGDAAPGAAGGTFSAFSGSVLNDVGQVAFQASITGSNYSSSTQGIFLGDGIATTAIARQGTTAPGGGFYGDTFNPVLNNAGQVAFRSQIVSDYDLFLGDGTTTTAIARTGDAAPGGGTLLSGAQQQTLNDSGQVAFFDFDSAPGVNQGIFRRDGTSTYAIARGNDPAPGGGTFTTLSYPTLNNAGQVAFSANITGSASTQGIFRGNGASTTIIARQGDAAPGAGGGSINYAGRAALNDAGQVAFHATVTGSTSMDGIFLGDGASTGAIVRQGDAAPGAGGGTFLHFSDPALNDAGQVAFRSDLTGFSSGGSGGIFRGGSGPLTAIVREGDAAPDAGGATFLQVDPNHYGSQITDTGTVAFYGRIAGGGIGGSSAGGVWLGDGLETIELVREGEALAGSTIATLFEPGAGTLNQYGQLSYAARLADGREGVFVATPDLHWRNAGSGAWDTTGNWTVGLRPGDPHRVFIDTANNLVVTGPAGDVSVKELAIGGGGGLPTLRLNAGGNLTVTGDLTVQTGTLDQEIGTLSAGNLINSGSLYQNGGVLDVAGTFTNNAGATIHGTANVGHLDNFSSLTLDGGTITTGSSTVVNDFGALMNAYGAISGPLENDGTLNVTGLLSVTGAATNLGEINAGAGQTLRLNGSLSNFGAVNLSGGAVAGSGAVTNEGVIAGHGAVGAMMNNGVVRATGGLLNIGNLSHGNGVAGQMLVDNGATMNVNSAFNNDGAIVLGGAAATLGGATGEIGNAGTLSGAGTVAKTVANDGTVRADGGRLTLTAAGNTNHGRGAVEASAGNEVFYSQGLAGNAGTIALTGGAFDNNGNALTNAASGVIAGRGTLRTGGLTNQGHLSLANGTTDVIGTVANDAATDVNDATVSFFHQVTNNGTFTSNRSTVNFLNGFVNNGTLVTDPNVMNFTDFTNNDPAAVVAAAGDQFNVSNDMLGNTKNNTGWNTTGAILSFVAGADNAHTMELQGIDLGVSLAGLSDNFAWGTLDLTTGQTLSLADAETNYTAGSGALYLDTILLAGFAADIGDGIIDEIAGNGLNIYYNADAAGNGYLGGLNYNLAGGGQLIAYRQATAKAPAPAAGLLLLTGLGGLIGLRRRRRAG